MSCPDTAIDEERNSARRSNLYRRAHEIHHLALIARDCAAQGPYLDLHRAERLLKRIANLAAYSKGSGIED